MAYTKLTRDKVRELRFNGLSLNQISSEMKVPRTTVHDWVSDINLSKKQEEFLKSKVQKALQEGRIKLQKNEKEKRVIKERTLFEKGKGELINLSSREFFIAGVALYWGEGFKNKHEHRLGFCNSDPQMIKFYLKWLATSLKINKKNIVARLALNEQYKDKEGEIKKYWIKITNIPLSQFTKTFYQKVKWKKQYGNNDYHGVLRIHVKNSLDHLLNMRGWIEGLKSNVVKY